MSNTDQLTADVENGIDVLHVDDEPDLSELAKMYLERENERLCIQTAESAGEAMDMLAEFEFDCVISDYDMPGKDGLALLKTIRKRWPDVPFILYTGKGSEEIASEAISAGATDYLQKGTNSEQYEILCNRVVNAVERDRARQSMGEVRQIFSQLANQVNDCLWAFSSDWSETVFVNQAYEDIFGQPRIELEEDATAFLEAVHPDDREDVENAMARITSGEKINIAFRVNATENYGRYVNVNAGPIRDVNGEITYVGGFTRDVTEQKMRENELTRAERQYKAIFEDPNILAAILNEHGDIIDINRAAMDYVTSDNDSVIGQPLWENPLWGDDKILRNQVKRWVRRATNGEYVPFETEMRTSDGTEMISGVMRPVTDSEGEVTEVIVSNQFR